jgi:hypothetical protein
MGDRPGEIFTIANASSASITERQSPYRRPSAKGEVKMAPDGDPTVFSTITSSFGALDSPELDRLPWWKPRMSSWEVWV